MATMRYGLIAGKKGSKLKNSINASTGVKIDTLWETTKDLVLALEKYPPAIIDGMEAILVMDTGLQNFRDTHKASLDFLQLQDIMVSKNMNHVRLYLVTLNVDLYDKLKGNINGMEGMYYPLAEMFLKQGSIPVPYFHSIMQGNLDKTGVFSSKRNQLSVIERLQVEKEALVDSAKRVSQDILEYGKNEPISEINQEEVLGSKQYEAKIRNRDKEIARLERENAKLEKKGAKTIKSESKEPEVVEKPSNTFREIEIVLGRGALENTNNGVEKTESFKDVETETSLSKDGLDVPKTKPEINPITKPATKPISNLEKPEEFKPIAKAEGSVTFKVQDNSGIPTISEIKELYKQLAGTASDTTEQKLTSDRGVISFLGVRGSGTSGLVAQTAEIYAMLNKKVLIIDLDLQLRTQTMYFPNYKNAVKEHKGTSNSLIRLTQTNDIMSNAVPVTSKISVLSNEKVNETVNDGFHSTITGIFENIIAEARSMFDIILLDIPLEHLGFYIRHANEIDTNIFVLENKFYAVEDFFSVDLASIIKTNDIFSKDLISKSNVVLNKYDKRNRNPEGYQINKFKVKEMLMKAGYPYDNIQVLGEIPLYKDWEEQYFTNNRYVWTDDLALGVYRNIVSRFF